MFRVLFVSCLLSLIPYPLSLIPHLLSPAYCTPKSPTLRVGQITIRGNTRTRTEIIRRELLLREGGPFDTALVEESERNLRRLGYLGRAEIAVQADSTDGTVALTVEVEDVYSRALAPILFGEAGELNYGGTAIDNNFLGRGQIVHLTARHRAVQGDDASAYFEEPRLSGSRVGVAINLSAGSDGHDLELEVGQPLYALSARWAYGFIVSRSQSVERLYAGGALTQRYTDRTKVGTAWLVRAFGRRVKVYPSLRWSLADETFDPSPGFSYAPNDRSRRVVAAGLTLWRPRYEEARFLDLLGRVEDVQIGSSASLRVGLSHRALRSDRDFVTLGAGFFPRFKPAPNAYGFLDLQVGVRRAGGGYENLLAAGQVRHYLQFRGVHTLALRARWEEIHRPEDRTQLLLGVDAGLRGYPPRALDGSRRFLLNVEARPVFVQRPFYVLAGALFADLGGVWREGERVAPRDLHLGLGFGPRLGLPKVYDAPVARLDLVYAPQRRAWQIAVGIGPYF